MADKAIPHDKIQAALRALEPLAASAARHHVTAGLDGFVDEICHLVARREDFDTYTRLETINDLAARIADAAGHSTNIEMVVQQTKIGGNGPIMANALGYLGLPLTYIGALGRPALHEVFRPLAAHGKLISLCEPAHTDACEFTDGKIMLGKMTSLTEITPETLLREVGEEALLAMLAEADLLALVNWTMIPHLSRVFDFFTSQLLPKVKRHPSALARPFAFFDLCDPAKRSPQDLRDALRLIARFGATHHVILGLNEKEALQVTAVLDGAHIKDPAQMAAHVRQKLDVDEVVVHPTAYAVAAERSMSDVAQCDGPFMRKPKITTGAGDHFNAGYCFARVLGVPPQHAVCIGKATSGFYVRTARSPMSGELMEFMGAWSRGELEG